MRGYKYGSVVIALLILSFIPFNEGSAASQVTFEQVTFVIGTKNRAGDCSYDYSTNWPSNALKPVPFEPDVTSYGYLVELSDDRAVLVTEIIMFPRVPKSFARYLGSERSATRDGQTISISKDLRTLSFTRRVRPARDRFIGQTWAIEKGDPSGDYSITVLINGHLVETFHFQVVDPEYAEKELSTERQLACRMNDLVEKQNELKGLVSACLQEEWGQPGEYSTMMQRTAYLQVDRLIARHQNLVASWQRCQERAQTQFRLLNKLLDEIKLTALPYTLTNKNISTVVSSLTKYIEQSEGIVNSAFSEIVNMHQGYVASFETLKKVGPESGESLLKFPGLVRKEHSVVKLFRREAESALALLEAGYALSPSVLLEARIDNAKIQIALIKASDIAFGSDYRTYPETIKDFRRELQLARFLTYRVLDNEKLMKLKPESEQHYVALLSDLKRFDEIIGALEDMSTYDFSNISTEEAASLQLLVDQALQEMDQIGERIDSRFAILEGILG